jgi:amino acid adenylation domain-containing protein
MTSPNQSPQNPSRNPIEPSAAKQSLLELRLAKERNAASAPSNPNILVAKSIPMSFEQERMWFLNQFEPDSVACNLPTVLHFHGPLDIAILDRSLNEILRRHQVLRTVYRQEAGRPVQEVREFTPVAIAVVDLQGATLTAKEAEAERLVREEVSRSFTLSDDLMFRAQLIRFAEDKHWLIMTTHHIAFDAWSRGVLHDELGALYAAFHDGRTSPLSELPLQYIDYAIRQRERMQGEVDDRLLSYWREQLLGAPPTLDLPTDRPRPERQSYQGAIQTLTLSAELTDSIKRIGQQEGTTQFMTLLAAFQLLLSRFTGQKDVVVGTPIAGRLRTEYESLIGSFFNTLALRSNLSDDLTFLNLLANVRQTTLEAYDHQELPFEELVEVLRPDRSLNRSQLVQVLFNGVSIDPPLWKVVGVTVEPVEWGEQPSKFDLTIYAIERNDQLVLRLSYNSSLFNPERMACLLDQYRFLLEQVVAAPGSTLESYSLITPASRAILPDPRVALEVPKQVRVADQITFITNNMPDQVAICHGSSSWTYRELDRASSAFVHVLQEGEIKKGDVVAICGEPSFVLISSIVGVLKSESILVLIDPKLPVARQRLLLDQAGTHLLVIVGDEKSDIDSLAGDRTVLRIAKTSGEVVTRREFQREENPSRSSRRFSEDAAYIFFTSGTAGTPKSVLGSHQGLSHFIQWQRTQFDVGANDRVAQVTKLSFDVVLREIFLPLTSGATLCLPERSVDDPIELWQWLEENKVTIVHGVPSRLRMWLGSVPANISLPSFRWLFMAGEPLSKTLVEAWRSSFAGEVINLYGPTETTLAKSWYRVPRGEEVGDGIQPIGNALPETQLVLLSDKGRLCGIAEPGEILIRTPFRSLGYLDADQTRERFVPNPFREDVNDLLYRSGDVGRYRPDGLLDIHGRLDDQVKIGGVRIQPIEIATLLSTYERVRDCYVGAVSNSRGELQLVAWVVPSPGNSPTASELRGHLAAHLPDAMIPSRFVLLDALPLNHSGKLDRQSLPAPDDSRSEFATCYIAPRTPIEQQLIDIWKDILGIQEIGIYDNFFELGGHSLLATRINARIRREIDIVLPLRDIFLHPTVESSALNILKQQMLSTETSDMENLLNELETMEEESDTAVDNPFLSHKTLPKIEDSNFHCPRSRSIWFGRRKCNLVIVLNEIFELASFERLAGYVCEFDSSIDVTIVPDGPWVQPPLANRPTLIFSPAFIRHLPPSSGRVFCGNPLSKSEEYHALEKSGIPVPKWLLLSETNTPDLSTFDDFVVRKPDNGGYGEEVIITNKNRVRWSPITTSSAGTSSATIIQRFIYTGPKPISYRVNTLFGKVLYSIKQQSKNDRRELMGPNDFRGEEYPIVATASGFHSQLNFDTEILRFAEHAHSAFPEIPLLGFDIVREVPSGKLYVLEANAIGYVWKFVSDRAIFQVRKFGFLYEDQFDGVRKAAFILAEKTQQSAR